MKIIGWVFLLLIAFGIFGMFAAPRQPASTKGQLQADTTRVATIDKSPSMQAERKGFLERAIQEGAFQKIETPGSLPRVWVKPGFYTLDFDDKASYVSVVYAYYFDGSDQSDLVRIFDGKTGKEIGSYSDSGLRLN